MGLPYLVLHTFVGNYGVTITKDNTNDIMLKFNYFDLLLTQSDLETLWNLQESISEIDMEGKYHE